MFWARFWTRLPRNRRQERKGFDHQFCQRPFPQKRERPFFYFHISTTNRHESYQFPETIGTNLGRAGSPLPAARPDNDCGAHGVTRPTNVPIIYYWGTVSHELFLVGMVCRHPPARKVAVRCWALSKHRLDYGVYPRNEIFDLLFRGVAVPLVRA